MNDKLKLIREKIIEANPEIVKLKFGCEFQMCAGRVFTFFGMDCFNDGNRVYYLTDEKVVVGQMFSKKAIENWKIIGRPITLSDILLAIDKADPYYPIVVTQNCSMLGTYRGTMQSISDYPGQTWTDVVKWNPKKTLENQSKKYINFLYKLLK